MKILIIEDEKELQNSIKESLKKESYVVETADEYHAALEKLFMYSYDCILLDIMLPNGSGLDILEELKKNGKNENVIIISAKDELNDKLKGLGLGADDYLAKPFHIAELNARIKAVLRRKKLDGSEKIEIGNVILDIDKRTFLVENKKVELNRKEFDILLHFMLNQNRLITRIGLAENVWGDHTDQAANFDFIYYQIKNLRKKLKHTNAAIEIQAIYGVGYKLTAP